MDLKSKIDTLNTEVDSLLQTRNFDSRKCKDLERRVLELEGEVESKSKMYEEIISDFQNVEEKISEFEQRESSYINTVDFLTLTDTLDSGPQGGTRKRREHPSKYVRRSS